MNKQSAASRQDYILTILVITDEIMREQGEAFAVVLRKRGHRVLQLDADELIFDLQNGMTTIWADSLPIKADGAIVATVEYGRDTPILLEALKSAGIITLNSAEGTNISADKFMTHLRLARAGVPMPRTSLVKSHEEAIMIASKYGYPVVFKTLNGESGDGVIRALSQDEAKAKLESFVPNGSLLMVQEYVECGGIDKRILVLDGKILAAMGRTAPPNSNEFRTNHNLGGAPFLVSVTQEEERIALAAARASGLRWTGIDIATTIEDGEHTKKGSVVVLFEINSVPGIVTMSRVTKVDLVLEATKGLEKSIYRQHKKKRLPTISKSN